MYVGRQNIHDNTKSLLTCTNLIINEAVLWAWGQFHRKCPIYSLDMGLEMFNLIQ